MLAIQKRNKLNYNSTHIYHTCHTRARAMAFKDKLPKSKQLSSFLKVLHSSIKMGGMHGYAQMPLQNPKNHNLFWKVNASPNNKDQELESFIAALSLMSQESSGPIIHLFNASNQRGSELGRCAH